MGSSGFNSHRLWCGVWHSSALPCLVPWAGVADARPGGSVLPLSLWGKHFSNPPTADVQAVVKKDYRGKNKKYLLNVMFWEYTPHLAPAKCIAWAKSAAVLG